MDLLSRVRRFVAEHHLAVRDTRVVVALSGGSDSVALAHLVRQLAEAGELAAAGLAHFNHQLRDAADADERFSVQLADSFGWPIYTEREDVRARGRRERRSIEDAARTARHAFFARARAHFGADVVALGHTRDDQAETFLLRLLRGAGPRGLAAMHPRNGIIVRPLLECRRAELRGYLAERHAPFVEDESNADVSIPRNRVRLELLPLLEQRFNPAIVDVLADQAELARGEWLWMLEESRTIAESLKSEVGSLKSSDFRLQTSKLLAVPLALRRVVLWRAMTEMSGGRPVTFDHVRSALDLLESPGSRSVDVPGHVVERAGTSLVLRKRDRAARGAIDHEVNLFEYPLSIPGEVPLPLAGCVVTAEPGPVAAPGAGTPAWAAPDRTMAIVRRDRCGGALRVRNRRPGDRFHPVGVGGRKKLQDYFVDRKVARQRRDQVPLVVDEANRIVWVAGFGIDEAFRVTDPAQAVIILRLKHLGGSA